MRGIDVSAWQESINWQGLKDEGFEFVIVKLGENESVSETYEQQVKETLENGLKLGVYYYSHATCREEAIAEADFVASQLQSCPEMGIWFDMEDSSIEESGADVTELCLTFVNRLHELGFDYVGIYSSYNWFTNVIDLSMLEGIPLWSAQYNYQNDLSIENPNANVVLWQYTDHISADLPYDGNQLQTYVVAGKGNVL